MKELSQDEIALLEEMKSNCLKKGQYIDEKAKDKFNMLCHLEDFVIAYYELLDAIKAVRQNLLDTKRLNRHIKDEYSEYLYMDIDHIDYLIKTLDKADTNV